MFWWIYNYKFIMLQVPDLKTTHIHILNVDKLQCNSWSAVVWTCRILYFNPYVTGLTVLRFGVSLGPWCHCFFIHHKLSSRVSQKELRLPKLKYFLLSLLSCWEKITLKSPNCFDILHGCLNFHRDRIVKKRYWWNL